MHFHVHGIYLMKYLNCVCVFYVKIDTTIERETEKSIQYDHETLKQVNMVAIKSESINKTLGINSIEYLESSYMHIMMFSCLS